MKVTAEHLANLTEAIAPLDTPERRTADVDERLHHLHQSNDCARHGWSGAAWRAVEEFEAQEAAPQTCTVTNAAGRSFTARLVRIGESVETKTKAIVEIYDDTYAGDPRFGPHGQRASSYYVDTFNEVKNGLALDAGVPAWQIGPDEVRTIQGWLDEVGADDQRWEDDPFTTAFPEPADEPPTPEQLADIARSQVNQAVAITLADGRSFSTKILGVIQRSPERPVQLLLKGWAYESGDFNPFTVTKYPLAQVADFAPFGADLFVAV
jgi:hypothetical protein